MTAEKPVLGRISSLGAVTALRRVMIDFDGPFLTENPATFRDYRLELVIEHADTGEAVRALGFFAADGAAASTGAMSGGVWRVSFTPSRHGLWRYRSEFRIGPDIALATTLGESDERLAALDGIEGAIDVGKSGRPGETPEGSLDLGGAGVMTLRGSRVTFPAVGLERPSLALPPWSALLGSDAFDDPARSENGEPLVAAATLGATADADVAPYARALRLVDQMAEAAAVKQAGLVRFDLFPAALGDLAAGPWRQSFLLGRAAIDPHCFDVSRVEQWEGLFARLAARGLGVELNLDPADPEEARAFWTAPKMLMARRLLLRELCARFSGLGAMLWRGSLTAEDRAWLAALDPDRAYAPAVENGENAGAVLLSATESAAEAVASAAAPAEAEAVSTRPPPGPDPLPETESAAADDDDGAREEGRGDQAAKEKDPTAQDAERRAEDPSTDATAMLESAGAVASTAMRRLSGLLHDAARASEAILNPPLSPKAELASDAKSTEDHAESRASQVAEQDGAERDGADPEKAEPDGPAAQEARELRAETASAPTGPTAPVVLAETAPRRLKVADLETISGSGDLVASLYRLDDSPDAPEAEPLQATGPGGEPQGLDLSGFSNSGASLIIRLAGGRAAEAQRMRLWVRTLRSLSDVVAPPTASEDERRVGPPPLTEAAQPFALFTDLTAIAEVSRRGPAQIVVEALGAMGAAGNGDLGSTDQILTRWSFPLACEGGLARALAALPVDDGVDADVDAVDQVDAAPVSPALPQDLADKIQRAPQTEAPNRASENDGEEAASTAEDAPSPTSDREQRRERPVFFGALVSEAKRREVARRAADEEKQARDPISTTEPPVDDEAGNGPASDAAESSALSPKDALRSAPVVPNPTLGRSSESADLALRRLELIDSETDRRIATVREGARLDPAAMLGKRVTVKATLAGADAGQVARLRITLSGDELAQRAVDRPQPSEDECVGMFYGLMFQEGATELAIEALSDEDPTTAPLFVARRSLQVGD